MFISYENESIRESCLLLRPGTVNSSFSTDEIKEIRAIIADLRASPKLPDSPLIYTFDKNEKILTLSHGSFKILCKVISTIESPNDSQIERIKIFRIINIGLQNDVSLLNNNS